MSKLFGFSGDAAFCPKEPGLFLSLGSHVDVYFPPNKRSRVNAPYIVFGQNFEQKKQPSIELLPDECLFEVFRRLPIGQDRCSCACVSTRWLSLISNIRQDESSNNVETKLNVKTEDTEVEGDSDGYLTRSLEGKKATDVRLSAIAVGTASCGGLGKLVIKGSNSNCRGRVTDVGLRAISRGCPSLKVLSLWNLSSVGDEGLIEIAKGCRALEKVDLCHCPGITDKTVLALAKNCPNLTDLTIESCPNLGNEGLQAIGKCCPNIKSISITNCPLVGDQGIAGLLSSSTFVMEKVELQGLNISDVSLAVIGHYGKSITHLILTGLLNVTERGYWAMGRGQGLQKLRSCTLTSCQGVTDIGLEAIGKGCPNLKKFSLRKCAFLSDNGLVQFSKSAISLDNLLLEECHRITQIGFFGTLLTCGNKLKAFSVANCFGIKDLSLVIPHLSPCNALKSLSIKNCPGFGDASLNILSKLCPQLQNIELSGLQKITDSGLLPVIENSDAGLVKVNLSRSISLTDNLVSTLAGLHGWTLEVLNLDGCRKISDAGLVAISESCGLINDLDLSNCAITDTGILALANSNQLNLQILSVSGCVSVSDKSMRAFRKMGETLLGLNVQNCRAISNNTICFLVEQMWKCDILS